MRARGGFTFLEILVVLVILAVLAFVAVPKMGGVYRQNRLNAAARDLAAALRQARHTAVLMNEGCEVWLDPEAGEYQVRPVHLDLNGARADEPRHDRRDDDRYTPNAETTRLRLLPSRTFFTLLHSTATPGEKGRVSVLFYPDGSASGAFIGVQNDENLAFNIRVYKTTGKVEVARGDPVLPENVVPLFYLPERIEYQPISRPGG